MALAAQDSSAVPNVCHLGNNEAKRSRAIKREIKEEASVGRTRGEVRRGKRGTEAHHYLLSQDEHRERGRSGALLGQGGARLAELRVRFQARLAHDLYGGLREVLVRDYVVKQAIAGESRGAYAAVAVEHLEGREKEACTEEALTLASRKEKKEERGRRRRGREREEGKERRALGLRALAPVPTTCDRERSEPARGFLLPRRTPRAMANC